MRHVLEAQQFDVDLIQKLFERTDELRKYVDDLKRHHQRGNLLDGRVLFNVFYEPSTRTRMSFVAAAQNLGMQVVGTENAKEFSSAAKGETLEDTIRTLCQYEPDVIVIRHDETGALAKAAKVSSVPIINAGDGSGQHPTQALLDLYTIRQGVRPIDRDPLTDLEVIIGGDLRHGRTARSLAYLLTKFKPRQLIFVSPPSLRIGPDIKTYLRRRKVKFQELTNMEDLQTLVSGGIGDVIYWTRTQKERMDEADRGKATQFVITPEFMKQVANDVILMHPLPRVDEIHPSVDRDPRAVYFRQAGNGMYIRMALIEWCLEK